MTKNITDLLESAIVNEDTKQVLESAWESKLEEVRKQVREAVEDELREEYANRYAADKQELILAMESMISDAIKANTEETLEEQKKLREQRQALAEAIEEEKKKLQDETKSVVEALEKQVAESLNEKKEELSKKEKEVEESANKEITEAITTKTEVVETYKRKLEVLTNFVTETLQEHIQDLINEKKKCKDKALANEALVQQHIQKINESAMSKRAATQRRLNELEQFVVKHLTNEITEFHGDRKALVETRVKLLKENKKELAETKRQWIANASKLVEAAVTKQMTAELTQLKEDIQEARENMFGRRLFEAFHTEFLASSLSEGTRARALSEAVLAATSENKALTESVSVKDSEIASLKSKVRTLTESATRERSMATLLAPLNRSQKTVMKNLLESVKTEDLGKAFNKYLPSVLNESVPAAPRKVINESSSAKSLSEVTGNRSETIPAAVSETPANSELIELRRLAGLKN